MSIRAIIPEGSNSISVGGLYQWDYGRVLIIESADLGSEVVEVHFACTDMNEAIVRSCSFSNGVGSVTIPDSCLERTAPITAWVYRIDGTEGHTAKTIILPVTARTRPSVARDVPQEISDKYTELITEINEAVDALESGDVTVALANKATNADYATAAGNATTANHALTADNATTATTANVAKGVKYPSSQGFLVEANDSAYYDNLAPGLYWLEFTAPGDARAIAASGLIVIGAYTASIALGDLAFTAKAGPDGEYIIHTGSNVTGGACRIEVANTTSEDVVVMPRCALKFS